MLENDPLAALEQAHQLAKDASSYRSQPGYEPITMIGRRTSEALIAELRASRRIVEAAQRVIDPNRRGMPYTQQEALHELEVALRSINVRNTDSEEK